MSGLQDWMRQRAEQEPAPLDRCPRQAEATMAVQRKHRSKWRDEGEGWWTCSYCGSLSPESLWRAVREGMTLGPTDKSYKVYVREVDVHGAGKFYFQHFVEDEDKRRFVEAMNEGALLLGYPGRFYQLPFFVGTE